MRRGVQRMGQRHVLSLYWGNIQGDGPTGRDMATADTSETTEIQPPGFVVPGIRCGLEMALAASLVLLVGLPAGHTIYRGLLVVTALVVMTVILFWSLNRQMEIWIARARRTGAPGNDGTQG